MLGEEKDAVETDLKNMAQAIVKRRDEMNVQSLQELCEEHNDSAKEISEEMQNLQRIEAQVSHGGDAEPAAYCGPGESCRRCRTCSVLRSR